MPQTLSDAQFGFLLEVAFVATDEGLAHEAGELFQVLARLRAHDPYPWIGQALVAHGQRRLGESIERLESVIGRFPQAVFTRSLLARFMKEAGRPDWQRYAHEALAMARHGVAADLARDLLGGDGSLEEPPARAAEANPGAARRSIRFA